jgi:ABC-2 type transport system permease protein
MPPADLTQTAGHPAARPAAAAACRQFPTAWRFALRNQTRNRLAGLLLVAFVPAWYLLMLAIVGHRPLSFRLYATGQTLTVDGGQLTLISAGLNSLTSSSALPSSPPSAGHWPSTSAWFLLATARQR